MTTFAPAFRKLNINNKKKQFVMATGNFKYENRCVVVTDWDLENENLPTLGCVLERSISHTTREIDPEKNGIKPKIDLHFYSIAYCNGYYEGGCIDYVELETTLDDVIGYASAYNSENKSDLIYNVRSYLPYLSKNALSKAIGNIKGQKYNDWIDGALERITEIVKGYEQKECNRILDEIKQEYGYEEYETFATFSNGETIYQKVS